MKLLHNNDKVPVLNILLAEILEMWFWSVHCYRYYNTRKLYCSKGIDIHKRVCLEYDLLYSLLQKLISFLSHNKKIQRFNCD